MRSFRSWAFLIASFLMASPAAAVDGVLEINQSCVASGCFPGDSPGYPVEITNPTGRTSSYRLTSDLSTIDVNTTVIQILVNSVTLDLNGFEIRGPVLCQGVVPSCDSSGTGIGVQATSSPSAITVKNGSVRGMGANGIELLNASRVLDVIASGSAGNGIQCGGYCLIRNNIASFNGGSGIVASSHSLVLGNTAAKNIGYGLNLNSSAGYEDNAMTGNLTAAVLGGTQLGTNICNGNTSCP